MERCVVFAIVFVLITLVVASIVVTLASRVWSKSDDRESREALETVESSAPAPAQTSGEVSVAPWGPYTDLIMVVSHFSEDLQWLFRRSPVPVVVCGRRGEQEHPFPQSNCYMDVNFGLEASAYLAFIVRNYDSLPNPVMFVHGHERSWHQVSDLLEEARLGRWRGRSYYSLNGVTFDDRKPGNGIFDAAVALWPTLFEPFLKRPAPARLLHDCCAQFVVSRAAIQRNPPAAYARWLAVASGQEPVGYSSREVAVMFEYVWHVIFGEPDVVD